MVSVQQYPRSARCECGACVYTSALASRRFPGADQRLPEDPDRELLSLKAAREQAEAQAINLALSKARGNLTLAASFLGIDRKVLRDIMERLGIKKEDFKGSKD